MLKMQKLLIKRENEMHYHCKLILYRHSKRIELF